MLVSEVLDLVGEALGLPPGRVRVESAYGDFAEWDSMGALAIVTALDRQGIKVSPSEIDCIGTANGIVELFRKYGRLV